MVAVMAGALIDNSDWASIDWKRTRSIVRRLQRRIAKAIKDGKWNKAKVLQRFLTRSFHARLLAVHRVTSNKGKRTPGVDGVLWTTPRLKWNAAARLKDPTFRPLPLRRIYIPKKNGKKRPLSIPSMLDRARQYLHKLALAPIAETTADKNSYGFREARCCADAIEAAFKGLARYNSAPWVLEADIKSCWVQMRQDDDLEFRQQALDTVR